jgi:hypothetical protein
MTGVKNVISMVREFVDGKLLDGLGVAHYPTGERYIGFFVGRRRQGPGQLSTPGIGVSYIGHWKHDEPDGIGEKTTETGDVYRGHFKEGKRHGYGMESFETGGTYYGTWKLDKRHACGIFKVREAVFRR